jgi:hypothetical protein
LPTTPFECSQCGMPICNPERTGVRQGRTQTCLYEHQHSTHSETKCGGLYYNNKKFPSELKRKPLLKLQSPKKIKSTKLEMEFV